MPVTIPNKLDVIVTAVRQIRVTMYQATDFQLSQHEFSFKKDTYPLSKINNVRVKKLSLLDNLGQIIFWVVVFSGALWLAIPSIESAPYWVKVVVVLLTAIGFIFGLFRSSKYALQIEFCHIDETGTQWVNVAKSYTESDGELFQQQALTLKEKCA